MIIFELKCFYCQLLVIAATMLTCDVTPYMTSLIRGVIRAPERFLAPGPTRPLGGPVYQEELRQSVAPTNEQLANAYSKELTLGFAVSSHKLFRY